MSRIPNTGVTTSLNSGRNAKLSPHLKILHGVPVVLHKDDGVGAGEVEPEAAHTGGQQQQVDAGIRVEAGDEAVAGGRGHGAVQPQVGQAGQVHLHKPNQSISFNPP
jgi:hypothetical protein